jgi:hypothetical protein
VAATNQYAYVVVNGHKGHYADGGTLQVYDATNPQDPRRVGSCGISLAATDIAIAGNYALVAAVEPALEVVDLSEPTHPQRIGRCALEGVRPSYGSLIRISGRYACVARSSPEGMAILWVIDLADPAHPVPRGRCEFQGAVHDLAVSGNHAYMATSDAGIQIIAVSDPDAPRVVADYAAGSEVNCVAAVGQWLYAALGQALEVVDVADPRDPRRVNSLAAGDVSGLTVSGSHLYASANGGFEVISISNPTAPERVAGLRGSWWRWGGPIVVSGAYAFVAYDLRVIHIADPTSPKFVGSIDTGSEVGDVAVAGRYAYVAYGGGLKILNLSNPANPRRVGSWYGDGMVVAVAVAGRYAYAVEEWWDGQQASSTVMSVLDVSDPVNPRQLGRLESKYGWKRASGDRMGAEWTIQGEHIYVLSPEEGLQIISVADPAHPRQVGAWASERPDEWRPFALAVSGDYACVTDGNELAVLDVSDSANPRRVGGMGVECCWSEYASVAIAGTRAYVTGIWYDDSAGEQRGLRVIDMSDPTKPREVGRYETGYEARVAVSGNYALVHSGSSASIVDFKDPAYPQEVGRIILSVALADLALVGDDVYFATTWNKFVGPGEGLLVFHVPVVANPQRAGTLQTPLALTKLCISGSHAYMVEGNDLLVINASAPATPRIVSRWSPAGEITELAGTVDEDGALAISGDLAYAVGSLYAAGASRGSLETIDLTDPIHPRRIGAWIDEQGQFFPTDVAVVEGYAYVTGYAGLRVIDVRDPARPTLVGGCSVRGRVVAVSGSRAYTSDDPGWQGSATGLTVIDISDPAHPYRIGGNSLGQANDLAMVGEFVYAATDTGLVVFHTYQTPPRLESAVLDDSGCRVSVRGEAGQSVLVQRSHDLEAWEDWVSLTASGSSQEVVDPRAASRPLQFYRAVTVP